MDGESIDEERNKDVATSKGCLIDFKELKVGDSLYSILYGECVVESISDDNRTYPIRVRYKTGNYMDFSEDGKSALSHIGPSLFTENPYTFAMKKMKAFQQIAINLTIQNGELWEKLNQKTRYV
jgi:hypothetical protein